MNTIRHQRHWWTKTVVVDRRGDWRMASADGATETYDVATNIWRYWDWGTSPEGERARERGAPPCNMQEQPAAGDDGSFILPRLRDSAGLRNPDVSVQNVTALGRPAWRISTRGLHLDFADGSDTGVTIVVAMALVVDKATAVILSRTFYDATGAVFYQIRVTRLDLDSKLSPGEPRTGFPAGSHFEPLPEDTNVNWEATPQHPIMTLNGDAQEVSLPLAKLATRGGGGKLFVAGWVPRGFTMRQASYGDGVNVLYRAGLGRLHLQVQWASNMIAGAPGKGERITLTGGAFAGSVVVIDDQGSACVVRNGIRLDVDGDVSESELVRVLNSIRAYRPGMGAA